MREDTGKELIVFMGNLAVAWKLIIQILKRTASCYRGWWQWHCICKTRGMDRTVVVLITSDDPDVVCFALVYLDDLVQIRDCQNAIVLSTDSEILERACSSSKKILATKKINERQKDDLLQLMCLYRFDERFVCAALDEPAGRNGSRFIGRKGISKEEIVAVGIYGLNSLKNAKTEFE